MGVDAKWGRFPICPEVSRFVPVCPFLSRFVPVPGPKKDKRGQTGTKRDTSGQIGKRPHLASTLEKALTRYRAIFTKKAASVQVGVFWSFFCSHEISPKQCPWHTLSWARECPQCPVPIYGFSQNILSGCRHCSHTTERYHEWSCCV